MKRILSLIIVVTMFIGVFSFSAFAEENEEAKKLACFRINWATQSYVTYDYSTKKNTPTNYELYYTVDKTARYIYTTGTVDYDRKGGGRAYFSLQKFAINDSTHYEYVFKAKNNIEKEYAGIVFAFGGGLAYIMYGSFNNSAAEPNTGVSYITLTKGLHAASGKDCSTGFEGRYLKVALDSEGFGHYKIVYNGYKVSVYAITDMEKGTYTQLGSTITLPNDAEIALGVYARTEKNGDPNYTVNLSDCLLYAMNDQAKQAIGSLDDGSARLASLIEEAKANYSATDNTGPTYRELMRVVEDAQALLDSWNFTAEQINQMEKELDDALDQMEVNEADLTKLQAAIASFEALISEEYTTISYGMVAQTVTEAKALLSKENVRQSRVDDATAEILSRMEMLVPSGYKAPVSGSDGSESVSDGGSESSTETGEETFERGCKSAIAGVSALVVASLIAVSALAIKKKED